MKLVIISAAFLAIIVTACSAPTSTPPGAVTEIPPTPTPRASVPTQNPLPTMAEPAPTQTATPEPIPPVIPPSGYEPQPGDEKLSRDQVFIELEKSSLDIKAGYPVPVNVILVGNMPDPCHQLRVVVSEPDEKQAINLEVYTLIDPAMACIAVIEPFEASIPLGSFSSGQFEVRVNGEVLGEFGVGYEPQPGDENMTGDQEVFLDLENSQLLTTATDPTQASAVLRGNLPDACHQLRVVTSEVDSANAIRLKAYSLLESGIRCTDMLKPFQAIIPLGNFSSGHYSVYVNDQLLGEFDG